MSNTNDFVIENGVLKRYKGFGRKVTIPEGVTSIGNQAFYNCNSITSITIPDGVKSIGNEAFYNCTGIKSVTLPSSVTYIGEKAFIDCKKLETISIPDSVTFLGDNAFENCIKLANVILSGSLTAIGDKVFSWCNSLTGITIPDGVTEIGERAFSNCKMLQSISIPDSLTKIDAGAFHGTEWYCNQPSGLIYAGKVAYGFKGEMTENTAVALDSGTIGIADGAFKNCQNLSGISIPDSLTRIGKGAFQNCKALQSIDVPESVTSIGGNAFDGTAWYDNQPDGLVYAGSSAYQYKGTMPADTNIEIKGGTAGISDYAFENCTNLIGITIPEGVTNIGEKAFSGCSGIRSLLLPDTLTEIGNRAFACCPITEVIIPKSVRRAPQGAFNKCSSITIFDSIDPDTKPCKDNFDDSNGVLNSSIGIIGVSCCSDRAIHLEYIHGKQEWNDHEIIVRSAETGEIKFKVWMGADNRQHNYYCAIASSWGRNASFNFPAVDQMFSSVKGTEHKIRYAVNRLRYPVDLTEETETSFKKYLSRSGKEVVRFCIDRNDMETLRFCEPFGIIKKNVVDELIDYASGKQSTEFLAYLIDYKALHFTSKRSGSSELNKKMPSETALLKEQFGTKKLEDGTLTIVSYKGSDDTVVIPDMIGKNKVTQISDDAFSPDRNRITPEAKAVCGNIKSVTIGKNITEIGFGAFRNCTKLCSLTIDNSVKVLGAAFFNCFGLADADGFVIVNGVLFNYCKNDKRSVTIPQGVTSIGGVAFNDHSELEEVTFPDGLLEINYGAFENCTLLQSVSLPNTVKNVDYEAFAGCTAMKTFVMPGQGYTYGGTFNGCKSLESVTFPYLTSFGTNPSFKGCTKLKEVCIAEGVKSLNLLLLKPILKKLKTIKLPGSIEKVETRYEDWPPQVKVYTIPGSAAAESALKAGVKVFDIHNPKLQITE